MSQMAVKESQAVSTAQSTAVVKNCVRLAISTVAFARDLFPKDAFVSKNYAGVNLEVLRPMDAKGNVVNEGALRVHEWLEKGAFKAMDQNYLDKVTFNILDAHPSDRNAQVLESYSFRVMSKGDSKKGPIAVEVSERRNNKSANVTTSTCTTTKTITRDEVHAAMQKLVRTLVMLTSSLKPLPTTRWLSMSITYNENAPPAYEAPEFCPQDPATQPRFAGEEPLVIGVGEVDTGFQTVALKFRQAVTENEAELPCTQKIQHVDDMHDGNADDIQTGYDSDSTEKRWLKDQKEVLATARRIAQSAKATGKSPEAALRASELGKNLPEQVLAEIMSQLKLSENDAKEVVEDVAPFHPPPVVNSTSKRTSRVKRPLQQIAAVSGEDAEAFEQPVEVKKKTRQTYGKRV